MKMRRVNGSWSEQKISLRSAIMPSFQLHAFQLYLREQQMTKKTNKNWGHYFILIPKTK